MEKKGREPFYVPLHFDLEGKTCLFVGGGRVNERRVLSLLPSGARLVVVSPELTPPLRNLVGEGRVEWRRRTFSEGDLEGVFLVFVAIDGDPGPIVEAARKKGVPVNLASSGKEGDFIVPSVVREGPLLLSLSTSGKSPSLTKAVAGRLRERLKRELLEIVEQGRESDGGE